MNADDKKFQPSHSFNYSDFRNRTDDRFRSYSNPNQHQISQSFTSNDRSILKRSLSNEKTLNEKDFYCVKISSLSSNIDERVLKDELLQEFQRVPGFHGIHMSTLEDERFAVIAFKTKTSIEVVLVRSGKPFLGHPLVISKYNALDELKFETFTNKKIRTGLKEEESPIESYSMFTRVCFVGNLDNSVKLQDLKSIFERFGEIVNIAIKRKPPNLSSFAFINYIDIESTIRAYNAMNGKQMVNSFIKVGYGRTTPSNMILISKLPENIDEDSIKDIMENFGQITSIVIDDHLNQALLTYSNEESANIAIKEAKEKELFGRYLLTDYYSKEAKEAFIERIKNRFNKNNSSMDIIYSKIKDINSKEIDNNFHIIVDINDHHNIMNQNNNNNNVDNNNNNVDNNNNNVDNIINQKNNSSKENFKINSIKPSSLETLNILSVPKQLLDDLNNNNHQQMYSHKTSDLNKQTKKNMKYNELSESINLHVTETNLCDSIVLKDVLMELSTKQITSNIIINNGLSTKYNYNSNSNPAHSNKMNKLSNNSIDKSISLLPVEISLKKDILSKYPIIWQGMLSLKSNNVYVNFHFISGNSSLLSDNKNNSFNINQRITLKQSQLDIIVNHMTDNNYCLCIAFSNDDNNHHLQQSDQTSVIRKIFLSYFQQKQSAGVVNMTNKNSNIVTIMHIFTICEFFMKQLKCHATELNIDSFKSQNLMNESLLILILRQ